MFNKLKAIAKKSVKKVGREAIHIGKRYRITHNLIEEKILPLVNKYKKRRLDNVKISVSDIYYDKFSLAKSFGVRFTQANNVRINIMYDDFDKKSFFGGKATALILANKLAEKHSYKLRIIGTNIQPEVYRTFLEVFGEAEVQDLSYVDFNKQKKLDVSDKDVFIATNGFSASTILNNPLLINNNLFYVMQEVETMFYDHGDTYLFISQAMKHPKVIPIVNTKLLYDWFCEKGYENVKKQGVHFEPAFPLGYKYRNVNKKTKKPYKLFFYARPNHQRNLFYFGIKTLNQAFLSGALDPDKWIVYMSDDGTTPLFKFDSGVKVEKLKQMDWLEYNEFLREIDLTYAMMYTPHPSYPPIDTAMIGGVVVANKYANKQSLANYSKNIITAELNESDMVNAFRDASKLVEDNEKRINNYSENNINHSWDDALKDVIEYMKDKIENV